MHPKRGGGDVERGGGDVGEFDHFRPPDSIFWIDLTTAEAHTPQ
jgi:hypothetical protein